MELQLRHAQDRGSSQHSWLSSTHSFSFASYYDPRFIHFRSLRVLNDDTIAPHSGFPTHGHENMEILTIVLQGSVTHSDSMGFSESISAGGCQLISAGSGITHSEMNHGDTPLRLLQIWIMPQQKNSLPRYSSIPPIQVPMNSWQCIAAPNPTENVMPIYQDATIMMGHFQPQHSIEWPLSMGRAVYLHVIDGWVSMAGQLVTTGDAMMVSNMDCLNIMVLKQAHLLLFDLK